MTDLDVMLKWYAPDNVDVVLYCDECGKPQTSVDGRTRKVLCPECAQMRRNSRRLRGSAKCAGGFASTGSPETDLVLALIIDAAREVKSGDRDAAQFLVAHDGAELWLKAVGIGVTNDMRRVLGLLSIGAE
jgi:hypothetical protein